MGHLTRDDRPLNAQLIRNVGFGMLRGLLVGPVPFLLIPLILSKIGPRGYGTWAVFAAMNGLTSLADIGLTGTLSKYVAEYRAHQNSVQLSRLLSTALAVFGLMALAIGAGLWILSPTFVRVLFRQSALDPGELIHLVRCSSVLVGINLVSFPFSSATSGLQRMDLTHMMGTLNVLCAAIAGAALLLTGRGVQGLVYASIASALVTLVIHGWLTRRLLPEVKLNPLLANRQEVKKILSFSLRIYSTQAAVAIHNQVEKFYLAVFTGVVAVGWYDIANDAAWKVRSVPALLLSPVLPAASELDALRQENKLIMLYYRVQKYLAFVGIPLIFFLVVASNRLVELWIGSSLRFVAVPLSILMLVNLVNLATGPGYMILAGQGDLRPAIYSALLGAGLNLPLSLVMIYSYGFGGAVAGTSISLVAAAAFFLYLFHRNSRYSFTRVLREAYLKPFMCSIFLLALQFYIVPGRNLSWLGLFLQGLAFSFLYTVALLFSGFFDLFDFERLESLVPIARLARKIVSVT